MPPWLSGFVCAYHPAAPGSSPKHTIYGFIVFVLYLSCEKDENKQKEAGFGLFKKSIRTNTCFSLNNSPPASLDTCTLGFQ